MEGYQPVRIDTDERAAWVVFDPVARRFSCPCETPEEAAAIGRRWKCQNARLLNTMPCELFLPGEYLAQASPSWFYSRDGDNRALAIFERHYSCYHYKDGRKRKAFVGPGQKIVLLTADASALFVWRRFMRPSDDGQEGVNCSVFRNESEMRSSDLIRESCDIAWLRWPGERLYTYVNPRAIKSKNPGYCFLKSGWSKCGITKCKRLIILERLAN